MRRVFQPEDVVETNGRYTVKRGAAERQAGGAAGRTPGGRLSGRDVPRVSDGACPRQAAPPYKSKWEASYAQHLDILKAAGEILQWKYEPIRFLLPGTRNTYKPDFLVWLLVKERDGNWVEFHEVKGWSKNRRDGITKLKTAAGLNTWATFKLVSWDRERGQWIEQRVG